MKVFRIAKTHYIEDLSGTGARNYGGRWNHKGTSVIYTSESRALATVEYLVHTPLSILPSDLSLATIEVSDEIVPQEIIVSSLPRNWQQYPAPSKLAQIGQDWVTKRNHLLLRVPSVVVEHEFNILINPLHPDVKNVRVVQVKNFRLDTRLSGK